MNDENIIWSAPAYDQREHSTDWYWAVSIITISLAIAFFITGNVLLSLIIIIGMGTLLFHAKQTPGLLEYELSRRGIRAGETLYPWETLESFWILEELNTEKGHVGAKILITSKKALVQHIIIPLGEASVDDIHHIIAQMLPEEPQVEPMPDRLMRKLGF
ncbi:MAG: hypothetical protein A2481_04305 [Candidatus Yonathbacteria bacterium RIFOXYC2_FULL_47_9]|nr:MAG: hypothetical protein A2481_04305 [Candidatus Yonathbacteria bacterium RIFOXYC2_FULL_47_9]HAT68808.1 hypothetical protein [Candidatus Yonathbacteria bacterium]